MSILLSFLISFNLFSINVNFENFQRKYSNKCSYEEKNGLKIYKFSTNLYDVESVWNKNNNILLLEFKSQNKITMESVKSLLDEYCNGVNFEKDKYISVIDRDLYIFGSTININKCFSDKERKNLVLFSEREKSFNSNIDILDSTFEDFLLRKNLEYSLIIVDKKIEDYFDQYYDEMDFDSFISLKLRYAYFLNSKKIAESVLDNVYEKQLQYRNINRHLLPKFIKNCYQIFNTYFDSVYKNNGYLFSPKRKYIILQSKVQLFVNKKEKKDLCYFFDYDEKNILLDLEYNNFYPKVKTNGEKIIYLTDELKKIFLDFLGKTKVIYSEKNKRIVNSKEESLIRLDKQKFLSPILNVWPAETGTWYLTSIPIIHKFFFNIDIDCVTVPYFENDVGNFISFRKINGKWNKNKEIIFHEFGKEIVVED